MFIVTFAKKIKKQILYIIAMIAKYFFVNNVKKTLVKFINIAIIKLKIRNNMMMLKIKLILLEINLKI